LATEWLVDNVTVVQAARAVEGASKPGAVEFRRLPDDANIVVFSIMADKSTYCGNVRIQDTAVGRRTRLKITVADDASKEPPKPGGIGGLFSKKASYAARPEVVEKATETLKGVLPPI
jgi:hypothetical protein